MATAQSPGAWERERNTKLRYLDEHLANQEPIAATATSPPQYQQPHIYRPIPRRNFSTTSQLSVRSEDLLNQPASPDFANNEASDFLAQLNARLLRTNNAGMDNDDQVEDRGISKSQSFLNAKSTLFGIYGEGESTTDTPWGIGAETPGLEDATPGHELGVGLGMGSRNGGLNMASAKRIQTQSNGHGKISGNGKTIQRRPLSRRSSNHPGQKRGVWRVAAISGKLLSLFLFGAVYGVIVSHLHDTKQLNAVNVGGMNRDSWKYMAGWGLAGLLFGTLLPYVDLMTDGGDGRGEQRESSQDLEERKEGAEPSPGEKLNELLRSVAAFAGIAFAIRRLPWESTLQLTITLALVNPALWYILDRTRNGLSFSFITTSIITSFIFLSNPDVLPSPSHLPATSISNTSSAAHLPSKSAGHTSSVGPEDMFAGFISYDNLATMTWVGSVIFCSCICFGGIGRRSAVLDEWGWKRS